MATMNSKLRVEDFRDKAVSTVITFAQPEEHEETALPLSFSGEAVFLYFEKEVVLRVTKIDEGTVIDEVLDPDPDAEYTPFTEVEVNLTDENHKNQKHNPNCTWAYSIVIKTW